MAYSPTQRVSIRLPRLSSWYGVFAHPLTRMSPARDARLYARAEPWFPNPFLSVLPLHVGSPSRSVPFTHASEVASSNSSRVDPGVLMLRISTRFSRCGL